MESSQPSTHSGNTWASRAPMPTARQAYATGTDTWSARASLPSARYSGDGAGLINGLIYVPGGFNAAGAPTRTLYAYSISGNSWTTRAQMPTVSGCGGCGGCGGSGVISGKLYVFTGCTTTSNHTGLLHRYDPATNAWTTLPAAPNLHQFASISVVNNQLYVAGGTLALNSATTAVDVYDPATNAWTSATPLAVARYNSAAATLNGKLYVFGGQDTNGNFLPGNADAYDPGTGIWSPLAALPTIRTDFSAAAVNGLLYTLGGLDQSLTISGVNEVYTP